MYTQMHIIDLKLDYSDSPRKQKDKHSYICWVIMKNEFFNINDVHIPLKLEVKID